MKIDWEEENIRRFVRRFPTAAILTGKINGHVIVIGVQKLESKEANLLMQEDLELGFGRRR